MKYVMMILAPIVMIAAAIFILWGMETSTGFVQMLWTALMIIAMVGLIFWDVMMQKTLTDKLIAVGFIIVIGGALKVLSFFVMDWPWTLFGPPNTDMSFLGVVSRLWTPLLNWWAFGGLALGSVISAVGLIWYTKTKKL